MHHSWNNCAEKAQVIFSNSESDPFRLRTLLRMGEDKQAICFFFFSPSSLFFTPDFHIRATIVDLFAPMWALQLEGTFQMFFLGATSIWSFRKRYWAMRPCSWARRGKTGGRWYTRRSTWLTSAGVNLNWNHFYTPFAVRDFFLVSCSIKSSFQLRTFDPEGVIFYGDNKKGQDWFVLSLKDGIPLMQIYRAGMYVSVAGGTKLSDGEWHTVRCHEQGVAAACCSTADCVLLSPVPPSWRWATTGILWSSRWTAPTNWWWRCIPWSRRRSSQANCDWPLAASSSTRTNLWFRLVCFNLSEPQFVVYLWILLCVQCSFYSPSLPVAFHEGPVDSSVTGGAEVWRLHEARQLVKPQHPLGDGGGGAVALLPTPATRQLLFWCRICHFQHLRWEQCAWHR